MLLNSSLFTLRSSLYLICRNPQGIHERITENLLSEVAAWHGLHAFKIVQNQDVFTEFMIASRRKAKCDKLVKDIHAKGYKMDIQTAEVDADDVEQLKALFSSYKPELVINLALPYQDLTIMDACLACGCNYMDTANYEPKDEAHFEYSWQWAYKDKFEQAGLCAILGCGFDPGVSGIFTAYAAKHHFDEIEVLDIVDCNAGNHHKAFATNFNPEINIREITQKGLWYKNGEWIETDPLSIHKPLTYPNIGPRESYLMHHEELESLVKNYPTIKEARFWMTFGQQYLTYLDCIQNLGMSRIDEIEYEAPLADGSGKTAKHAALFAAMDTALKNHLTALCKMSGKALADQRYKKFRQIGEAKRA